METEKGPHKDYIGGVYKEFRRSVFHEASADCPKNNGVLFHMLFGCRVGACHVLCRDCQSTVKTWGGRPCNSGSAPFLTW